MKTYLGDGLYASFDGYHIWLTAENGISIQNKVAIEPAVYHALRNWVDRDLKAVFASHGIDSPF